MIGTKCTTCNGLYFPPKSLCPECRRKGAVTSYKFSGNGEIETFTIIHNAPKGFEEQVPYIIAIIKTDGNVRISGQIIDVDVNEIEKKNVDLIGKKVSHVFRKLSQDDINGLIHYGLKWQIEE